MKDTVQPVIKKKWYPSWKLDFQSESSENMIFNF